MSKHFKNNGAIRTESRKSGSQELESHGADSLHAESHDSRSDSGSLNQKGYQFAVANGSVSSVAEVEHGVTKTKYIKPYQTYSVSGADVLKTESKGVFQEISRYTDGNADGIYQKTSEATVLNVGAATTTLQLQKALSHSDHMKFDLDVSDQVLSASHVLSNGAVVNEPLNANTQFSVQNGFMVEAVTAGTATRWEIFRDGNGDGIYTEVAHGLGPIVDLVGLATNLAAVDLLL